VGCNGDLVNILDVSGLVIDYQRQIGTLAPNIGLSSEMLFLFFTDKLFQTCHGACGDFIIER
jgi:hypothetical protein